MSNQIVISSGAKVRSLEGVLTGTAGIVNSVPLGGANGVATLDALGKVPLSQLPASVVTYLGTWNAATNTPTLTNGVGDVGDLYICNVAGTVNFGAGPITFASGDWVIYNGSQWQKSAGSSGTVTSVALSSTGNDAITITGSPITTSGTINIGFTGTSGQYVNGAGDLTTFPSFVSSVGLASTASAFTITNSPITSSGNIGLNFSGNSGQYVAGDGSLITFPSIITQAQNLVTEVYNQTGATLTKGTVVYINGGHGNLPTITKAIATGDATSAQTYGLVRADITNNNNGYVTVIGNLDNMDTQAYADGTQLYLSSTTAGAYTSVKQYAPAHLVYVGIVVRSHPTQGVIEVRIQNGFELDELHNVSAQTPSNNQGIFYNSSTSLWENKSIATALGYTPADDSLVVKLAGTQTITGQKTFSAVITGDAGISLKEGVVPSGVGYTGLAGDADGLLITKRVGSTAYTNLLSFTGSTSNTYAFPNASGTVALTSNLSSYVPYTGATTNVNLGSYNATALNFISTNGYAFDINASPFFSSNQSFLSSTDSKFYLTQNPSSTGALKSIALDITDLGTGSYSRNYKFPNINGTFALLEGTQTFSGEKTFNGDAIFTSQYVKLDGAGSSMGNTINFKQFSSILSRGVGYSSIGAVGTTKMAFTFGNTTAFDGRNIYFDAVNVTTGGSRTYSFPDANGTLVLGTGTTNYLPKFTGANTLGNSLMTDDGSKITISSANTTLVLDTTSASYDASLRLNNNSSATTWGILQAGPGAISGGGMNMYTTGAYPFTLGTNGTERMRITSAGNVGIGTSSPSGKLDVSGQVNVINGAINFGGSGSAASTDPAIYRIGGINDLAFAIGSTERMRITSGGVIGIGNTTYNPTIQLKTGGGSSYRGMITLDNSNDEISLIAGTDQGYAYGPFVHLVGKDRYGTNTAGWIDIIAGNASGNTNYGFISFQTANTLRMQISWNGAIGTTAGGTNIYNPSDFRLKKNIVLSPYGLDAVLALKPSKFNWRDGFSESEQDKDMLGFIAQDVQEVIPEAVESFGNDVVVKTEEYDFSVENPLRVNEKFIIPVLVKAMQEQNALISELSAKVSALENKS
jgi:hypothetical protein